jgi:hypothetical protein
VRRTFNNQMHASMIIEIASHFHGSYLTAFNSEFSCLFSLTNNKLIDKISLRLSFNNVNFKTFPSPHTIIFKLHIFIPIFGQVQARNGAKHIYIYIYIYMHLSIIICLRHIICSVGFNFLGLQELIYILEK